MKKQIVMSIFFAIILLSLSGCMGMHHLHYDSHETANDVPVSHGTNVYSGGCH